MSEAPDGGSRVAGGGNGGGEAVQVDPMKPTLKAPGTKRLKLKYDELVSCFASFSTCAAARRRRRRHLRRRTVCA